MAVCCLFLGPPHENKNAICTPPGKSHSFDVCIYTFRMQFPRRSASRASVPCGVPPHPSPEHHGCRSPPTHPGGESTFLGRHASRCGIRGFYLCAIRSALHALMFLTFLYAYSLCALRYSFSYVEPLPADNHNRALPFAKLHIGRSLCWKGDIDE